jgi:hypothetical protein
LPSIIEGVEGDVMARNKRMRLATWLVSHNLITLDQAHEVMREQKEQTGHIRDRFGRIAVNKGYITEEALTKAYLAKEREEAQF